jgi:hypothetical protein
MLVCVDVDWCRLGLSPYADLVREPERQGAEDWDVVARAIQDRLAETRATQMDVASRARVSLTTLRELQHNLNPRRRRPQTLAAVSEALGWPAGYLASVLHGEQAQPHPDEAGDPVLANLTTLEREIHDLRARVDAIERQLSGGDA